MFFFVQRVLIETEIVCTTFLCVYACGFTNYINHLDLPALRLFEVLWLQLFKESVNYCHRWISARTKHISRKMVENLSLVFTVHPRQSVDLCQLNIIFTIHICSYFPTIKLKKWDTGDIVTVFKNLVFHCIGSRNVYQWHTSNLPLL